MNFLVGTQAQDPRGYDEAVSPTEPLLWTLSVVATELKRDRRRAGPAGGSSGSSPQDGAWNPAGLTTDCDEKRGLRATELNHGRAFWLATSGYHGPAGGWLDGLRIAIEAWLGIGELTEEVTSADGRSDAGGLRQETDGPSTTTLLRPMSPDLSLIPTS